MTSSSATVTLVVAGRTDRGRTRENNEDALLVRDLSGPSLAGPRSVIGVSRIDTTERGALVVVSDGMGGMKAGEVASELVVTLLADAFAAQAPVGPALMKELAESVNERIWEASQAPERDGMGATMTALYFLGSAVFLLQVGDSRAYLLRQGRLVQVTHDQTRVQMLLDAGTLTPEEAAAAPFRNVILQAMGTRPCVDVALARLDLRQGDRLLVCSDGLSNKLADADLCAELGRDLPFDAIADSLVLAANARGGEDNITAIVCGVTGTGLPEPIGSDPAQDLHPIMERWTIPPPARAPVRVQAPAATTDPTTDAAFERLLAEARARSHRGEYGPSLELARQAVARARAVGSRELAVRAMETEAATLTLTARGEEALPILESILALSRETPRSISLADSRVAHAVVSAHLGWVSVTGFVGPAPTAQRFEVLGHAEGLLLELGRPHWRSGVLGMRATLLRAVGRLDEAITVGAESIQCFSEGSPGSTLASQRQQHADILFDAGRSVEAERQYQAILIDGRRSVRDEKSAHVGVARCALRAGDLPRARSHAEEAVRVAKPLGDSAACGALHVLTHVLEAAGELDHAVAVADQHVEKARKTGSPQRQFFAVRIQIDLAFARADRDGARAWLEEAAALARQLDGAAGGDAYGRQLRDRRARLEAEAPSRG